MERRSNLADAALSLVGTFLIDAKRAHADLRSIRDIALQLRWRRMLVFGAYREAAKIRQGGGEIRDADSEDETDEGIWNPYLNWVNPLWKLQLAPEPSPMKILVQFLGMGTPLD